VLAVASMLLAAALSGCSAANTAFDGPAPQHSGPPVTYVAVLGAQPADTSDPRVTWSVVFSRSALPVWTTAYDLTVPADWELDGTALLQQVLDLHPTVVSVSLGLQDALSGVPAPTFSAALTQLLDALRTARVPTVLIANVLPLPGPQPQGAGFAGVISSYNQSIASDAAASGSVLVDVHSAFDRALARGQAVMAGGNSLTPLGESLMAGTFAAAARHRPLWRTTKPSRPDPPAGPSEG
jgi:hypothetical protein